MTMLKLAIRLGAVTFLGLLAAGSSACAAGGNSPSDPQGDRGKISFTSLVQVAVPGQTGGEIREVIRDAATWSQIWTQLRAGSSLPEAPPAVDFQKDMVIVAAMPTQSCVSKVTVRSIHDDPRELRVDLLEEPPAANCRCIVSQRPIHAVRLPRSAGGVRFMATVTPHAC
jgi:hypothetical protein